jgi:predicted tellurium resistance membrane protein TerC
MMVLLVIGMMNLGVIAMVALAITVERLARRPEAVARAAGVVVIAVGALLIARALGHNPSSRSVIAVTNQIRSDVTGATSEESTTRMRSPP